MSDTRKEAVERVDGFCKEAERRRDVGAAQDHILGLGVDLILYASDLRAILAERDALAAQLAEARSKLEEFGKAADHLGFHCVGCGRLCVDPEKDIASIRKSGGLSCCPERKMEPLSSAIASMVKSEPAPRHSVQEAAKASPIADLLPDVIERAEKAMRKFPQPNYIISKWAEESGEVTKALIHAAEGRETWENIRGELVDTLAMLHRLFVEGDEVHGLPPLRALAQKESE